MLRKKEEKNGKVKDETYYAITIEELRAMSKNLFLVAKDSNDDDGTYQIWSSGFDDEYIRHPTHGVMYEKHVVDDSSDKSMFGEFVEESKDKAKKQETSGRRNMFFDDCFEVPYDREGT